MEKTTHRQYRLLWLPWLDGQWEIPSRTDHYLMALRAEIVASNSKEGTELDINDFRLKFDRKPSSNASGSTSDQSTTPSENLSEEEQAALSSKALIGAFTKAFGANAVFKTRTKEEAEQFKFKQIKD